MLSGGRRAMVDVVWYGDGCRIHVYQVCIRCTDRQFALGVGVDHLPSSRVRKFGL